MKARIFTRVVILLSLVSLFTDISSEMLYPVMPLFLQSIGFNALWIGILEGTAQVAIGLSNGYFGMLSDRIGKRMPFVSGGYFLSAVSKPLMALSASTGWVFFARVTERLGKGIRTSARDALLADEASASHVGSVFGFHRAMDTLGAALGPGLALWYLATHPGDYRSLFLLAFIPGLAGASMTLLIRDRKREIKPTTPVKSFFSFFGYWRRSSRAFKMITGGLLAFALVNSADSFLFMMSKQAGLSDKNLILSYILYNIVFAIASYPAGSLADRIGMRNILVVGLCFFAVTYGGFGMLDSVPMLFVLFVFYGFFGAFTEGISKAWISRHCAAEERGTALGFYKSVSSLLGLVASTLTGLLWMVFSPGFALEFTAASTGLIILYFLFFLPAKEPISSIKLGH